jgi:hypothetical protein
VDGDADNKPIKSSKREGCPTASHVGTHYLAIHVAAIVDVTT